MTFEEARLRVMAVAQRAVQIAHEYRHTYATLEHVLAALLEEPDVQPCMAVLGVNEKQVADVLADFFEASFVPRSNGTLPARSADFDNLFTSVVAAICFSPPRPNIGALDVLLWLAQTEDDDSFALSALRRFGVTALKIKKYIAHGNRTASAPAQTETAGGEAASNEGEPQSEEQALKLLRKYALNLNEEAQAGRIDPVIGRADELEQIVQITARRSKNNVVLVGESGVGKTAIVEGLAKRIAESDVPDVLLGATVWALDIGALVAGTRFRGDFEERMKLVLKALALVTKPLLFIDEIHTIMDAGAGSKGSLDVANLLKPALARGALRCIGSTTSEEYRKHFEKDRALVRRFKKVLVGEPTPEDAKAILRGLRGAYETFHGVRFTEEAIDGAVDLTHRYVPTGLLPDKAIDVLDNAGARQRIAAPEGRRSLITLAEIEAEVSRISKIPVREMEESAADRLGRLEDNLNASVFGQRPALAALTDAVMVARAGLREPNRPEGAFLFTGPTGTGKTEAARQLAHTLGLDLVKFDMSEYMERHSVARLIGSPPGYVGFGDGAAGDGLLITAIDSKPCCVLLLDEIEKAHPDVFNLLLQVMDDGRLTSGSGKTVSFRNVILLMTSNAGIAASERGGIGFVPAEDASLVDEAALKRLFTPEFRNRLDATIAFDRLSPESLRRIVDKFLDGLEVMAAPRGVRLDVDEAARAWLARKGHDPVMGARPLARVIHQHIKKPLARLMLIGALRTGGVAVVRCEGTGLSVGVGA